MPRMGARIVPAAEGMAEAERLLRSGDLVAFPTETVYGLGADARNPEAVARIYAAKGRPSTNPLIVHVADAAAARTLAADWPRAADELAARFWPGPLTLVVPRAPGIPDIVTAGGPTIGVRVPAHPVARELLRLSGVPVAAPSANRSEEVSPTTARHVADSLGPHVEDLLILDGGACEVGVESTVLDVTADPPRVLRPGMVTAQMLAAVLGDAPAGAAGSGDGPARSPGQMLRHYAPRAPLLVLPASEIAAALRDGDGLILRDVPAPPGNAVAVTLPAHAEGYAVRLYSALRDVDAAGVTRILVEAPPREPGWEAIHDRLRRAAAPQETS